MTGKGSALFYFSGFLLWSFITAAPSKQAENQSVRAAAASAPRGEEATAANNRVIGTTKYPGEDMPAMQSHFITLEDFESLLRRAGELFRPNAYVADESTSVATAQQADTKPAPFVPPSTILLEMANTPYRQIQPPAIQSYNFYMPPFEREENPKLMDRKSKRMEHIAPPPAPAKGDDQTNYYAAKPKKLPKKFYAGTKQVNLKWLNAFEKEALHDANGQLPKAVYLLQDERNRINFDDSFFGADMQVKIPNNQLHRVESSVGGGRRNFAHAPHGHEEDFLNHSEAMGEEDLVAAAARQVIQRIK